MTSGGRRIVAAGILGALVAILPPPAIAASGRLHLETFNASGGAQRAFDIDTANVVVSTASSADLRLGTNRTTGYRQLAALNGAGVANLGEVDFAEIGCAELRAAPYASLINTGPSSFADPVAGTVYAAKSRIDTYVKLLLVEVDLTSPPGLVLDFVTTTCISDDTPPVVVPLVEGPAGDAGWHVGDVTVSWDVSDTESAIETRVGCDPVVLTDDTDGQTLTCTATSAGGSTDGTVTVKIDATPPVVSYTGNAGTYLVHEQVVVSCAASDATSGRASDTCVSVDAPAYTFGAGTHTLTATATDVAGNEGSGSATFTVVVDASGLDALIDDFVADDGVANSFKSKIDEASEAPNDHARNGMLNALRNEIRAQIGKSISEEDAEILLELLRSF